MVDMSLPAKFTSYVEAGRPIVAAVAPDGATAAEVERSGAGVVVPAGRQEEFLSVVDQLLTHEDAVAEMQARGAAYAGEHLTEERGLAGGRAFVAEVVQ
jgi:hypothetical protein